MKLIIGPRRSGKTTKLLELFSDAGPDAIMVVHSTHMLQDLVDQGVPEKQIRTVKQMEQSSCGNPRAKFFFDDLEALTENCFLTIAPVGFEAATISLEGTATIDITSPDDIQELTNKWQ